MQAEVDIHDEIECLRLKGSPVREATGEEGQVEKGLDKVMEPNVSVDDTTQN